MRDIESQPQRLKINSNGQQLISVGEHNGIHCLGQQTSMGEPVSPIDFRLYQVALVEGAHVPVEDARKKVKTLKEMYKTGDNLEKRRIADVMASAFEGLTRRVFTREPIAVPSEHVIYVRSR